MSEPERPSVVVSPCALFAMKPVTTGRMPAREERAQAPPHARVALLAVARRGPVAVVRDEQLAGVDGAGRDARLHERRGEERRREALAEGGHEVRDARGPLAQERDALESGGELAEGRRVEAHAERARGGLVALAQGLDRGAGGPDAAALGLAGGPEEDVRDASHRRGDGHDPALAARGGQETRGVADAVGVAERRAAELVDRDRSSTWGPDRTARGSAVGSRDASRESRLAALLAGAGARSPPGSGDARPRRRRLRLPSRPGARAGGTRARGVVRGLLDRRRRP